MIPASSEVLFEISQYPDFPVPFKNGTGARIGHVIYAGLGSAGTLWFSLDLSCADATWQSLADFPGDTRDQSVAIVDEGKLFVFGGAGSVRCSDGTTDTVIFCDGHCFEPAVDRWQKLDTFSPRSLLGSSAVVANGRALFFGGVNQAVFETYFRDLKSAGADAQRKTTIDTAYLCMRPESYQFSNEVLSYSPAANTWQSLGTLPFPPTVGAAVAFDGEHVTLINGELKPGLRSYGVNQIETVSDTLRSRVVPDLVAPEGELQQEGLAGAFAGYSCGVLLAAGGANFPGAWNQYRQRQHYAHRGLKKIWRDEVYALVDGEWRVAGRLPEGRAYGLSLQLDDGVLLVGGESDGGRAVMDVCLLRWGTSGG